jgi:hypothetical protein
MLPAFPPDIPVTRIQSRAFHPDYKWGINAIVRKRVAEHKGPFALLFAHHQKDIALGALPFYGLTLVPGSCAKVTDNMAEADAPEHLTRVPAAYDLCKVEKDRAGP